MTTYDIPVNVKKKKKFFNDKNGQRCFSRHSDEMQLSYSVHWTLFSVHCQRRYFEKLLHVTAFRERQIVSRLDSIRRCLEQHLKRRKKNEQSVVSFLFLKLLLLSHKSDLDVEQDFCWGNGIICHSWQHRETIFFFLVLRTFFPSFLCGKALGTQAVSRYFSFFFMPLAARKKIDGPQMAPVS